MKSFNKALSATSLAVFLGVGMTVPAGAQQQEGLINVNVSDVDVGVISNVQVPVAIAANVCGVDVNVLAEQLPGDVNCEADAESTADKQAVHAFRREAGSSRGN